ncbi:MAG: acyltransferase family protein, partial [Rivularia sp. (in: cyanobacteria)]
MQSNNIKNNRLDALLALRGFACLMVVTIHCAPPRKSIIYDGFDLSWLMFSHGAIAVWIFFVLSGYLMGKVFYT